MAKYETTLKVYSDTRDRLLAKVPKKMSVDRWLNLAMDHFEEMEKSLSENDF